MLNHCAAKTQEVFYKTLLCHDSKEGLDEKGGLCLPQEDVGGRIQRLSSCCTNGHAQKPAHLHDNPLEKKPVNCDGHAQKPAHLHDDPLE